MSAPTVWRLERKFLVPPHALTSAEPLIRGHPDLFSECYPPRGVHSVYLDTVGLRHYRESVAGVKQRRKLRVRWYGEADGLAESECALEVKSKEGWAGSKQVISLGHLPGGSVTRASLREALGPDAPTALHTLMPVLLVSYRRRYFRSASGQFRLTLDTDVSYARAEGGPVPRSLLHEAGGVLELKYSVDANHGAERITQHLPFRLSRNSKYARGIDRTRS